MLADNERHGAQAPYRGAVTAADKLEEEPGGGREGGKDG